MTAWLYRPKCLSLSQNVYRGKVKVAAKRSVVCYLREPPAFQLSKKKNTAKLGIERDGHSSTFHNHNFLT